MSAPVLGEIKGTPLSLFLPNIDCVRQVKEAAMNAVASYIIDNPEYRHEWEAYRNSLKEEPSSQL